MALKHIQELEYLEESSLAHLPAVAELASAEFSDAVIPAGSALQRVLFESVNLVIRDLGGQPEYHRVIKFLNGIVDGQTVTEISHELGLSREHVARTVQPKSVALVGRVFLAKAAKDQEQCDSENCGNQDFVWLLVPPGYGTEMTKDKTDTTLRNRVIASKCRP